MGTSKANPLEAHPLPSQVVKDDEPVLVAAAKAGDISAFETLVGRYERKIFRLAQNITQNKEDAEDTMQEAFLKSYQNLDRFQGDSRFYTWLVRIAVNEALMKLRKRRPNQVSLDEPLAGSDGEESLFREIVDWGPSPEKKFAQVELNEILNGVIGDNPNLAGQLAGSDVDTIAVNLVANHRYEFTTDAATIGSALDTQLILMDANGHQVALSDDTPPPGESPSGRNSLRQCGQATAGGGSSRFTSL